MFSRDEELTPEESMARSRSRKRRRVANSRQVSNKGTLAVVESYFVKDDCNEMTKCLFRKMINIGLFDDFTEPKLVHCLAANAEALFNAAIACSRSKESNGLEFTKEIFDKRGEFDEISVIFRNNYTSLTDPEHKCSFWTISGAFLILYYELTTDDVFTVPLKSSMDDFRLFLKRYPEFLIRTWDAFDLFQYQLCMKLAVTVFGSKSNMGCLVEIVTFLMTDREIALCCNTSGGGLRDFDKPTEVSTEKCRVLIYHRETGSAPRKRKSRDGVPGPDGLPTNGRMNPYQMINGFAVPAPVAMQQMAMYPQTFPMQYRSIPVPSGYNDYQWLQHWQRQQYQYQSLAGYDYLPQAYYSTSHVPMQMPMPQQYFDGQELHEQTPVQQQVYPNMYAEQQYPHTYQDYQEY